MVRVTREFSFEAAHMLSGYVGACQNLHGHSYKLQVTFEGTPNAKDDDPDAGMVIDFKDLKEQVDELIIQKMDHAILFSNPGLQGTAEKELYNWATHHGMRHFILPGRCTAENIATYIRNTLMKHFVCVIYVKLWETEKSFVEV